MNVFKDANVTEKNETDSPFTFFSKDISFTLLLSFVIPSTLMHLIVLILILFNKTLRLALHNYVILFTLVYSFIITSFIIPTVLDSHRSKPTIHWSLVSCKIRSFIETMSVLAINLLLFIFYIYGSFIYPCENQVDFVNNICYYGCQSRDSFLGMWQTNIHCIVPTICVLACNGTLLFRVYRSKTRLRRSIDWRKYRIMIFQLVCIASLYLLFNLPFAIIYIWAIIASTPTVSTVWARLGFLTYFVPLLFPFVCLPSIPELRLKIKKFLCRRTVAPANLKI